MTQAPEFLPRMWETYMEFWLLAFCRPSPDYCTHMKSSCKWKIFLCLSHSPHGCLSFYNSAFDFNEKLSINKQHKLPYNTLRSTQSTGKMQQLEPNAFITKQWEWLINTWVEIKTIHGKTLVFLFFKEKGSFNCLCKDFGFALSVSNIFPVNTDQWLMISEN